VTRSGGVRGGTACLSESLLALLELHRHSRASLLVLGGSYAGRRAVVRAFHDASLARGGRLVELRCMHEEARLRRSLQSWLLAGAAGGELNPLRASEDGTLFLAGVHTLSEPTQRLLLVLARRVSGEVLEPGAVFPYRLAVGDAGELAGAVERGRFSAALFDCLDKIHVDLGGVRRRGAA